MLLGVSLSAASGFRIFVPPLVMSIAAQAGHLELAPGFGWMATQPALMMFAAATVLEVGAYYIPWLDELLDVIASPVAVVAGILATASVTGEMSPLLQWSLAILAGGTAAGLVQGTTDVVRLTSTIATGGVANPAVSTVELVSSTGLTLLAIALPLLTGILVISLLVYAGTRLRGVLRRRA
ncbi:DUF4126 domain-containing protein [Vacuolonema iberomarrocanum]|uniref:DUF4126 domain-containing protein n=1 Tax=Vacuolonema iberomarrocanum TaxID=3454632 RepID=UPI001A06E058|nr:DUF4126 domain-containing protein [filamentous cyanobacterium LEGE 07170]